MYNLTKIYKIYKIIRFLNEKTRLSFWPGLPVCWLQVKNPVYLFNRMKHLRYHTSAESMSTNFTKFIRFLNEKTRFSFWSGLPVCWLQVKNPAYLFNRMNKEAFTLAYKRRSMRRLMGSCTNCVCGAEIDLFGDHVTSYRLQSGTEHWSQRL